MTHSRRRLMAFSPPTPVESAKSKSKVRFPQNERRSSLSSGPMQTGAGFQGPYRLYRHSLPLYLRSRAVQGSTPQDNRARAVRGVVGRYGTSGCAVGNI